MRDFLPHDVVGTIVFVGLIVSLGLLGYGWEHRRSLSTPPRMTASQDAALPAMVEAFCIMDSTATDVAQHYVVPSTQVAGWCHATGEKVRVIMAVPESGNWRVGVLQDNATVYGVPARITVPRVGSKKD